MFNVLHMLYNWITSTFPLFHVSSDTPSDERKLLARDYIGDAYDFQLTEFCGPEIMSMEKRKEKEKDIYFIATTDRIDIDRKLEEGQEPRFPEEEGMYIGVRPAVKKLNQNKVENRYRIAIYSKYTLCQFYKYLLYLKTTIIDIFPFTNFARILKERSVKDGTDHHRNPWFGQDGRLVALPNPIQRMATRPPVLDESSSGR